MNTLRNQVQLVGFLGNDPEVKTTTSGKKLAHFRVATSENYRDAQGQWQTETTWHSIQCWENLAERVEQQLKKGSYVLLTGKLTYRKYTDNQQIERMITEIRLNGYVLLDRSAKNNNTETPEQQESEAVPFADDLPF